MFFLALQPHVLQAKELTELRSNDKQIEILIIFFFHFFIFNLYNLFYAKLYKKLTNDIKHL